MTFLLTSRNPISVLPTKCRYHYSFFIFQSAAKSINFPAPNNNQLRLKNLRSLKFFTRPRYTSEKELLSKRQHYCFIESLLRSSPHLTKLTTNWNNVINVNSPFITRQFVLFPLINLRHLHSTYGNESELFFLS